jgi:ATP phosphoribosyltransferase
MEKRLRFGLPIGSLNHTYRWQTRAFLDKAGFYTRGYEPGSRRYGPEFVNERIGHGLDIAILGQDWADEGEIAGCSTRKLCELGYGNVRIVAAVHEDSDFTTISDLIRARGEDGKVLRCYTEYIGLAKQILHDDEAYREIHGQKEPQVIVRQRTISGENDLVQIIDPQGTTELVCPSGFGDIIIDNTQTGTTLEMNSYRVIEEIKESCACLYASPYITLDAGWKYEEVQFIKRMLESAAKAENYDYFVFDVHKDRKDEMVAYLEEEKLFAKEPVLREGTDFYETNILVPKEKGLVVMRSLEKFGAQALVGLKPDRVF